jgi:predicted metal-binding membrane protein
MTPTVRAHRSGLAHPAAIGILSLAAVSWWLSVGRMHNMDAGPGVALGALGWFAATWLLMMAAMMLPVVAPAIAAECFPARTRAASPRRVLVAAAFVAGYLAVWAVAGAAAYLVLRAGRLLVGGAFEWHRSGQWLAVAVLAGAAAYQLTGTKRRWLAQCRAQFVRADEESLISEPGSGARAGLRAGAWCLASSWALMGVLFALGVMSLVWMALVATLIAAERLTPLASPARVAAAGVLLALAVGVAVAPGSIPGLTVPGSPAAQRAMTRMSGVGMGTGMSTGMPARARHPMPMAPGLNPQGR